MRRGFTWPTGPAARAAPTVRTSNAAFLECPHNWRQRTEDPQPRPRSATKGRPAGQFVRSLFPHRSLRKASFLISRAIHIPALHYVFSRI